MSNQAKILATKYKTLFDKAQINTTLRLAHFFGQGEVEADLKPKRESLNYTVEALLSNFGRHRISEADAKKYGRTSLQKANQVEIGNRIYGGNWGKINLGNTKPDDGYKLRGGGIYQITGRANWEKLSKDTGIDFINNPDLIIDEKNSIIAAIWFWNNRKLNDFADKDDVVSISKIINLGNKNSLATPNHLQERISATNKHKETFKI